MTREVRRLAPRKERTHLFERAFEGGMLRARWTVWLPATFAVVVLSFFAATVLGHLKMRAMDRSATEISENSAPSIASLTAVRTEIRHLQALEETALDRVEHGELASPKAMLDVHTALDEALNDYLVLSPRAGDRSVRVQILRARDAHDRAVSRFEMELMDGNTEGARETLRGDASASAEELDYQVMQSIELNAAYAHDLAREIQRLRGSATYLTFMLDAVCMVIAITGAMLLASVMNTHASLIERHAHLEQERASELEQFAGTVAHDILSPMSAVAFALELAGRQTESSERERVLKLGTAAVERVKCLVSGLLDFARAGATPDPDARANVGTVLADLAIELEPAAMAADIELSITNADVPDVRCHAGVLTSLIANLARNAIKYMGDSAVRRVEIRALDRGDRVRIDVHDTGPGLSPDVEKRVFEPYVRGRGSTQPGIGLGLATVRRLAESHGGRAGVSSITGGGSRFWFELPKAELTSSPRVVPASQEGSLDERLTPSCSA